MRQKPWTAQRTRNPVTAPVFRFLSRIEVIDKLRPDVIALREPERQPVQTVGVRGPNGDARDGMSALQIVQHGTGWFI